MPNSKETQSLFAALMGGKPMGDIANQVLAGGNSIPQQQQPAPPPASPEALGGGLHAALQQGEPPMAQGSGAITQGSPVIPTAGVDPAKAAIFGSRFR